MLFKPPGHKDHQQSGRDGSCCLGIKGKNSRILKTQHRIRVCLGYTPSSAGWWSGGLAVMAFAYRRELMTLQIPILLKILATGEKHHNAHFKWLFKYSTEQRTLCQMPAQSSLNVREGKKNWLPQSYFQRPQNGGQRKEKRQIGCRNKFLCPRVFTNIQKMMLPSTV